MASGTQPGWWTTVPGLLTAIAALVTAGTGLLLGLHQVGLLDSGSDQPPSREVTEGPSAGAQEGSTTGTRGAGDAFADFEISLPYGETIRVGDIAYELLSGTARPDADGQLAVVLTLRGRSYRDYDENFWDSSFRVAAGEEFYAASGGLNEILPANATKTGELLFVLPDTTREATLEIRFDDGERSVPMRIEPVPD